MTILPAAVTVLALLLGALPQSASQPPPAAPTPAAPPTLLAGQRHFYNGQYEDAVAIATKLTADDPNDLAASELLTSILHFQIKRALGDAQDKEKALKQCVACGEILKTFVAETRRAQAVAHARLKAHPAEDETEFLLGKIDLNYVWLQLATLGKRTGWNEYREARRSVEAVLKRNPAHVRAQVAHAWIEYIVDTRVPFGFKWMLGGGDKKDALAVMRKAAASASDPLDKTEATFGLWEMLIRDKKPKEAADIARTLLVDFPDNKELVKFVAANGK